METMYFVLGMLSIAGAAFVAITVWGVVKITKLLKAIKHQEEMIHSSDRNVWDNIHRLREDIDRRSEVITHDINHQLNDLQRELDTRFNQTVSYVDSRIDKASATSKEKKQLLKD
jgi:biopolymer transport protein ExbB/TolQ